MAAFEHRERARTALKGNWLWAALTSLVASLLGGITQSSASANYSETETQSIRGLEDLGNYIADYIPLIVGGIVIGLAVIAITLMLGSVVGLGYRSYTLSLIDGEPAEFKQLFSQFHRLWPAALMRLLIGLVEFVPLLIVVLVMLLVPLLGGLLLLVWMVAEIYISYGFVLADFVMAEDEHCTAMEALKRSWMLMKGQRWSYFCLGFSFIGWMLLSAFTFGIGGLFLTPYVQVSYASFYRDLKPKATGYHNDDGYTDYAGVNHEFL